MYKLWIALVVGLLAGCGGGGGGGSSPILTTQITGVALDGYLYGADVFYDLNDNGVLDSGEPSGTTGINGNYALTISPGDVGKHKVVLKAIAGQTIDSDNPGVPINAGYVLSATADHPEIVSPLTTQIVAAMAATPALTSAQAEAQVKATLGLSNSAATLFQDFANKTSQTSNTDLIMLANHAKIIRAEMQTQFAANPNANPLDVINTVASTIQAQIKSGALDLTKINIVTALDITRANSLMANADAATAKAAADAAAKTMGTATSIFGSPNSVYQ